MIRRRSAVRLVGALASQLGLAQMAVGEETPAVRPADAPIASEVPPAAPTEQRAADAVAAEEPTKSRKGMEEEIVVTGSRIRRKDLTTAAPIVELTREEFHATGKVSIGDFLQGLPEQGSALNTTFNSGAGGDGSTRVNLRNLSPNRTLVLLNGRRFVPSGSGADGSVDLNAIPSSIIERVEVLKDGASAIYGSDAIAGVINLITRKRMNGAEATAYTGTSRHMDGTVYDANATVGSSGDRHSILFSFGYYTQRSVFAGDRDFSKKPYAFDLSGRRTKDGLPGQYAIGSPTGQAAVISILPGQRGVPLANPSGDPRISFYNQLMQNYGRPSDFVEPTNPQFISDPTAPDCLSPGQCWRPIRTLLLPEDGGDGYNFQPDNYLVTPLQRISLYSIGETKLGEHVRGFFEGSYVNRQSDQRRAPETLGTAGERLVVSARNFYNPFGRDFSTGQPDTTPANQGSVERRLTEFGPRAQAQAIDSFRLVFGIDGTLPQSTGILKGWFWDASFNYGRTEGTTVKRGTLKLPRLQDALGPSYIDETGLHCGTPQQPIPGCVPLNLFGPIGSITPDQIANLTFTGNLRGTNQMTSAQFNTTGELFQLFADRPVGLAAGYEYRIVAGENIPDPVSAAGETTGRKAAITMGHYYVNEGYGELSVPVISGRPWIEQLEATAAVRVYSYSSFGAGQTYKFGGRWSLIPDFTVRGTYSTGFRAPNIGELFQGLVETFPFVQDPCRDAATAPPRCGADAGNGDTRRQIRSATAGNPNLKAESANIFTAGIVLQPRWIKNLSVTADYYNIYLDNSIGIITARTILSGCYNAGIERFCNLFERDPGTHRILSIIDIYQNLNNDRTAGVDIGVNYAHATRYGRLSFLFNGTWLQKWNRTLPDGTVVKSKGNYDLGLFLPAFKFISGPRWNYERFNIGVNTRWTSSFNECGSPTGDFNGSGACYINSTWVRRVAHYNAWDVFAGYRFSNLFGKTNIGVGINNVFDAQPPFIYNAGNSQGASDPSAYPDAYLGRFFYGRIQQVF